MPFEISELYTRLSEDDATITLGGVALAAPKPPPVPEPEPEPAPEPEPEPVFGECVFGLGAGGSPGNCELGAVDDEEVRTRSFCALSISMILIKKNKVCQDRLGTHSRDKTE